MRLEGLGYSNSYPRLMFALQHMPSHSPTVGAVSTPSDEEMRCSGQVMWAPAGPWKRLGGLWCHHAQRPAVAMKGGGDSSCHRQVLVKTHLSSCPVCTSLQCFETKWSPNSKMWAVTEEEGPSQGVEPMDQHELGGHISPGFFHN